MKIIDFKDYKDDIANGIVNSKKQKWILKVVENSYSFNEKHKPKDLEKHTVFSMDEIHAFNDFESEEMLMIFGLTILRDSIAENEVDTKKRISDLFKNDSGRKKKFNDLVESAKEKNTNTLQWIRRLKNLGVENFIIASIDGKYLKSFHKID